MIYITNQELKSFITIGETREIKEIIKDDYKIEKIRVFSNGCWIEIAMNDADLDISAVCIIKTSIKFQHIIMKDIQIPLDEEAIEDHNSYIKRLFIETDNKTEEAIEDHNSYIKQLFIETVELLHPSNSPKLIPERTWATFIHEGGKFTSKQILNISFRRYYESLPMVVVDPEDPENPPEPPIISTPNLQFISARER